MGGLSKETIVDHQDSISSHPPNSYQRYRKGGVSNNYNQTAGAKRTTLIDSRLDADSHTHTHNERSLTFSPSLTPSGLQSKYGGRSNGMIIVFVSSFNKSQYRLHSYVIVAVTINQSIYYSCASCPNGTVVWLCCTVH